MDSLTVPLPEFPSLKEPVEDMEKKFKLYLAMMLYKEREASLEKAARFVELSLEEFLYELSKHKISVFNYSPQELKDELKTLE